MTCACRRSRPVHTKRLLGAGILICEHMTGLGGLPDEGFRFSASAAQGARHGHLPGAGLCFVEIS
jgi:arylformamidase